MDKLTVLYVVRPAAGGMLTHVLDLVSNLPEHYQPYVVTPIAPRLQTGLNKAKIPYRLLAMAPNLSPFSDLRSALRLRKIIKELRPAFIHMHGNKASLLAHLATLGLKIPKLTTVHNLIKYKEKRSFWNSTALAVDRYLTKSLCRIIAVSHNLEKDLLALKYPKAKLAVIHNGIDSSLYRKSQADRVEVRGRLATGTLPLIGFIGRLAEQKDPLLFLKAAALILKKHQAKFLLGGDGPMRALVESTIAEYGLVTHVTLMGEVTTIEVLSSIDMLVITSRWEGLPYIVLEAMSVEVPIISTKVGGIPEALENKATGILVPPEDLSALVESMETLILDPAKGRALAEKALLRLEEDFSLTKMVELTLEQYQYCLRKEQREEK